MNLIIMDSANNYLNYIVADTAEKALEVYPDATVIDYDTPKGKIFMDKLTSNNYNKPVE
jgi:hypothetical protein